MSKGWLTRLILWTALLSAWLVSVGYLMRQLRPS